MKLKNTGNSVISVGKTVILPGESADIKEKGYQNKSADIKEKGYQNNAVISFLIARGILSEDTGAEKPRSKRTPSSKAKNKPAAEPETENQPEQE